MKAVLAKTKNRGDLIALIAIPLSCLIRFRWIFVVIFVCSLFLFGRAHFFRPTVYEMEAKLFIGRYTLVTPDGGRLLSEDLAEPEQTAQKLRLLNTYSNVDHTSKPSLFSVEGVREDTEGRISRKGVGLIRLKAHGASYAVLKPFLDGMIQPIITEHGHRISEIRAHQSQILSLSPGLFPSQSFNTYVDYFGPSLVSPNNYTRLINTLSAASMTLLTALILFSLVFAKLKNR